MSEKLKGNHDILRLSNVNVESHIYLSGNQSFKLMRRRYAMNYCKHESEIVYCIREYPLGIMQPTATNVKYLYKESILYKEIQSIKTF